VVTQAFFLTHSGRLTEPVGSANEDK